MKSPVLHYLINDCPVEKWRAQRFSIYLKLANGRSVGVSCDYKTLQTKRFTIEDTLEQFDRDILVNIDEAYGEYLATASEITSVINQKFGILLDDINTQTASALAALIHLELNQYEDARRILVDLGKRLLAYEPRASDIWAKWLDVALAYVDSKILGK